MSYFKYSSVVLVNQKIHCPFLVSTICDGKVCDGLEGFICPPECICGPDPTLGNPDYVHPDTPGRCRPSGMNCMM